MRDTLADLFDYDLWANRRWIEALPDHARGKEILTHIVRAHRNWLSICTSEEEMSEPLPDLAAEFERLNAAWKELIRICDLSAYASYNNRNGEPQFTMIDDIIRHVINHGTYHRGQLRGLMEAEGRTDFPETDLIKWVRGDR